MKFDLYDGESSTNQFTVLYRPQGGGKYNGKLHVTTHRLLYDAKFDYGAKGLLSEALTIKWGSEGYLEIANALITDVRTEKSMLSKRCVLTLTDGTEHTFDAGAMNIDKVADAIRSVLS